MQKTTSDGQDRPDRYSVACVLNDHTQGGSPEGPTNSEDSPAQSDGGSVWFSSSDAQYVGGTHWAAILDRIADLKEQLGRGGDGNVENPVMLHTFLLYGCKSASKEDILAALPDRPAVDRYISQHFNRLDLASYFGDVARSPLLHVLASSAADSTSSPGVRNSLVDTYREKIVQCLILGEYTKSGRYVFEPLYQYLTIEYSIRKDADRDI
ncbi:transcriptional regulator family: Fungal Specific TF [Penicillium atrosanguineum]|uniref:Transcriptional regulator family: Fungal Specific TF n=1 Tax=Penicillium atrosanguineum TaxID=1132637 RepID=A0A9W9Q4C3_9EURO|nr:transcriptional regulator family: Fungal Specific TF [Penicillium atrosanguineum]KAJ5324285.1 transcriptional regulator family: Fungal Specific TF [Penicillium atrosanguineum]